MHVTVGTLFLLFCWLRHFLTAMLPMDIANNQASTALVRVLAAFGYDPKKGRV